MSKGEMKIDPTAIEHRHQQSQIVNQLRPLSAKLKNAFKEHRCRAFSFTMV